ncbi:MAG TPA: metalloregulator ArsR/SmtB family transcription factor [Rhizomicrobium sp.]|nr:metalloregulator ArsR/SmtB family transcription factor [Rhizomicrobium sp.]
MEQLLAMLRAAGDPTRLRLLLLLREAELTVTELTHILGQSQPRVSRHLKLLCEAGLLQRFKEGSWVFYRAVDRGVRAQLGNTLAALAGAEPDVLEADRRRLAAIREQRAQAAAAYFKANASEWERIRSLHAPELEVEAAIVALLQGAEVDSLLDVGTGTGRMLELLAPAIRRGVGLDVSPEMLAIARDRLERAQVQHCQVRLGDLYRLPFADGSGEQGFDVVLFHQVLHYLDDPQAAIVEAARVLRPRGRLIAVDFAPHEVEFLRDELNHRRLGFSDEEVKGWFRAAGLAPSATRSIAPHVDSASAKLTVKIWAATSQKAPARARAEALS